MYEAFCIVAVGVRGGKSVRGRKYVTNVSLVGTLCLKRCFWISIVKHGQYLTTLTKRNSKGNKRHELNSTPSTRNLKQTVFKSWSGNGRKLDTLWFWSGTLRYKRVKTNEGLGGGPLFLRNTTTTVNNRENWIFQHLSGRGSRSKEARTVLRLYTYINFLRLFFTRATTVCKSDYYDKLDERITGFPNVEFS